MNFLSIGINELLILTLKTTMKGALLAAEVLCD